MPRRPVDLAIFSHGKNLYRHLRLALPGLYASGYDDAALERWAARIRAWSTGGQPDDAKLISDKAPPARAKRDVYCYFDNDIKVRAPFDARSLIEKLGLDDGPALFG